MNCRLKYYNDSSANKLTMKKNTIFNKLKMKKNQPNCQIESNDKQKDEKKRKKNGYCHYKIEKSN